MSVVAGRSRFSLATLKRDDFPVIAETDLPVRFTLSAGELKELIDSIRFAISTEETRYYLNGIHIHATAGSSPKLRGVATDGHRLARIELDLPAGAADMPGVIVPRKCVNEVRKLLDEMAGDAPVEVSLSAAKIRFRFSADTTLTSKLIDGTFPDYERVIPRNNDKVMEVRTQNFAQAVGRVAAISSERSRPVKLSISSDNLLLTASSAEQGEAREELDEGLVTYAASPIEIGFQARYLNDITEQVGETLRFKFSDGSAPTVVQDAADDDALYVLMPMRV
jgi:DNA polymerase-3 subunit beta